jgi:peptide/nickel transport system permease protein
MQSSNRMECEANDPRSSEGITFYEIKQHPPIWKRIFHNRMFFIGGTIALVLLLSALFIPPFVKTLPTKMNFLAQFAAPQWKYFMGTDQYGRDIFIRVVYGIRISLQVGALSVLIGLVIGMTIGAIAGYLGGFVDNLLMRILDSLLAFPPLLLAIGLVTTMGPGLKTVCISIGVIYIAQFARLMRSSVMVERTKEYVEAIQAIGQSKIKILFRHIGPNCLSPIIVLATVLFANAITLEAILSFLGVGIQPPTPSLGAMLNESRRYLASSISMALFPGILISLAVLGFNLLGDGLRDILDPRIYSGKSK